MNAPFSKLQVLFETGRSSGSQAWPFLQRMACSLGPSPAAFCARRMRRLARIRKTERGAESVSLGVSMIRCGPTEAFDLSGAVEAKEGISRVRQTVSRF